MKIIKRNTPVGVVTVDYEVVNGRVHGHVVNPDTSTDRPFTAKLVGSKFKVYIQNKAITFDHRISAPPTSVTKAKKKSPPKAKKAPRKILRVAIVRDHSASMYSLAAGAMVDYNENIRSLKESSGDLLETRLSVIRCGQGNSWENNTSLEFGDVLIENVPELQSYQTPGRSTPLLYSTVKAIELLQETSSDDDVFLVMVVTDGHENSSPPSYARKLKDLVAQLSGTDRWTFTFRVPRGHSGEITKFGIPSGNVSEWETTESGIRQSTTIQASSLSSYVSGIKTGQFTASRSFYQPDLSGVKIDDVRKDLNDVTAKVKVLRPQTEVVIRDFVAKSLGSFKKGEAFYELVKYEKAIQPYKKIMLQHKGTGRIFMGTAAEARPLLGIPVTTGDIRMQKGDHGNYRVFIQSTSVNRKVPAGTALMVLPGA